jgi:hypothetical protein
MTFIRFQNFNQTQHNTISREQLVEALLQVETKNPNRAREMVKGLNERVEFADAIQLFSNRVAALSVLQSIQPLSEAAINEGKQKPGPDPYMTGLDDSTEEEKEEQMKKQAKMADDNPDAYKEMPGDAEARKKGKVKTSKHTKAYNDLYGDKQNESLTWEGLLERINEARSINKIQNDWSKVTIQMKEVVAQWKEAQGKEKENLTKQLKDLTTKKKALEAELDAAVGMKDIDAELVPESTTKNTEFYRIPRKMIDNDLFSIQKGLSALYKDLDNGNDLRTISSLENLIDGLNKVLASAKKFKSAEEIKGTIYEAEVDIYTEIEDHLSQIYAKLNDLAKKTTDDKWKKAISSILNGFEGVENRMGQAASKLGIVPIKEADFGKPSNGDYSDEMSFGQLEKCIDYATMIRERIQQGTSLDPWMHSQIAVAENELNSVWDAVDGDDGVVEATSDTVLYKVHFKPEYSREDDSTNTPIEPVFVRMNTGERTKLSNYAAIDKIGGYGDKTPDQLLARERIGTTTMEFPELFKLIKTLHKIKIWR